MALAPGTRIATYEIVGLLGSGGMGEVYRARDTRLGREVAIKVLAARLAGDEVLLARIEREARLLASLNHPNIATIHGVEDWQGTPAIVMELIEGETLATRLMDGPLPINQILPIARQMAEALTAAHDRGIVHRDFKPGNVHVRPDGTVKVLDFGLAKSIVAEAGTSESHPVTSVGSIMGTAPYMSPEQARGDEVDRRTDIWAFGCTVYELLSGVRAFQRVTPADTIVAILSTDPDWERLPATTPDSLHLLLQRCLQRDPRQRLRDLADASFALEATDSQGGSGSFRIRKPAPPAWRRAVVPIVLVLGLIGAGVFVMQSRRPEEAPLRKYEVPVEGLGEQAGTFAGESGPGSGVLISPDGRRIVYPALGRLWVRELSELTSKELDGTQKAVSPSWAPDSQWVVYAVGEQLRKSPVSGGAAVSIATVPGGFIEAGSAAWSPDGVIYYTTGNGPMWKVSAEGGDPEKLIDTEAGVNDYHDAVIANRRLMIVTHHNYNQFSVDLVEGGRREVLLGPFPFTIRNAAFSRTGHIVFQRVDNNPGIWAVAVDPGTLKPRGEPFMLASGGLRPSVADDGTLVYVTDETWGLLQLSLVDRAGTVVGNIGDPRRGMQFAALSPEGDRAVVMAPSAGGENDLWVFDVAQGSVTRLTTTGARGYPAWSPDGSKIAYSCGRSGTEGGICVTNAGGGADPVVAIPGGSQPSFTPDGKHLVYVLLDPKTRTDIWFGPLDRSTPPVLIKRTPAFDFSATVSPDGGFVAYSSSESGKPEVYVADFPDPRRRWQVSSNTGALVCWSPKGGELFFVDGAGQMQAVSFDAAGRASKPQLLFAESVARMHLTLGFSPLPDGQRFLVIRDVDRGNVRPRITVVQNWFAEFANRSTP
jgi:Tol biopolymer transport system component